MDRRDIMSRLSEGDRLLLDGGIGSELQRRGLNLSKGVKSEYETGPWSATAMGDAPEVVRAVHEDYLRVGADITTTNSFWTNRPMLGMVGLADRMEAYTRLSAEIACEARDRLNPDAYVAGSMSPPRSGDLAKEFADQSAVLAAAGADLLLLELIGSISDAVVSVDAVSKAGLPIFLGITASLEGTLITGTGVDTGETVEELVQALKGRQVDAILPMCSRPERISATLPRLRECFDGVIGGYSNLGYKHTRRRVDYPKQQFLYIQVDYTPEQYAEFGRQWLDLGAQIVGGCCASTPEHIGALRPVLKG